MSLIDKLNSELTAAMRSGDQAAKLALRAVKTAIREAEVAGTEARSLSDDEILAVIAKQAKQRRDSIAEFEKGNRPDLVEKEQSELAVLEVYLPQQLEREEIVARARKVIADVGASSTRQMGLVMRPLMEELQGVADGKLVSQVVQQLLRDAPG
ncbi:MAG TPA: GatB/YqeY domain-containing protein [Anaerolineae bacterium]|nr:GatB/YqeY domain-containing protein [Anaerolineae bacterium]